MDDTLDTLNDIHEMMNELIIEKTAQDFVLAEIVNVMNQNTAGTRLRIRENLQRLIDQSRGDSPELAEAIDELAQTL